MMQTQTKEKQIVLKAIDSLGRRVTPADVASKTGLALLPVTATLNQIAAETNGHMEVGEKGDIAYKFDPGFQSRYLAKGFQEVLQKVWDKVFAIGFFLVKISFGIMLIINAIIIFILIAVVIIWWQQRRGDDDDGFGGFGGHGGGYGGGYGGGFHFSFFDYILLRELLFPRPRFDYRTYDYGTPTIRKSKDNNFFFNTFSFLFGDGDPNQNQEHHKWSMIAEVIRRNKGVATAEQLAPYLGSNPSDEDAVLPVLVRFNGRPEVTEDGDIIYLFDDMQITAMESQFRHQLPSYLSEWTWKFTNVPASQMLMVYGLAGFNLLGSIFLLGQMTAMEASRYGNPLEGFAPMIYFLLVSATLFVVVPLCRWIVLNFKNAKIAARNAKRLENAKYLESPPENVLKKLENAKRMSLENRVITDQNTVFTTERDSLEQDFDASP